MADTPPVLASRYRLDERIAVGGVGEVWRAQDLTLGRPVALKLLRAEYAEHSETLARFRSEARHAASVSHPGIAQVYDYDEGCDPYPPFLVMELVDGPSLADVLADGPLGPARTMDIVAQAATGLDAAHRAGLVHRDIKPANLLLEAGGRVKITDFGIAHAAGSAPFTRHGLLIGTPAYLAPERVAGQQATAASDLYSLGILAYECLTGQRPYAGTVTETALAHGQQPLPALPGSVPPQVAAFVAELAAKDPAGRPTSAAIAAARAAELRDSIADGTVGLGPGAAWQRADPATLAFEHPATPTNPIPLPAAEAGDRLPGGWGPGEWGSGDWRTGDWGPGDWRTGDRAPGDRRTSSPRTRGRAWPPGLVALAIAAAAIAAGAAGWTLSSVVGATTPAASTRSSPPARSSSPGSGTVAVRSGALIGLPVRVVVRDLRALGLRPTVRWTHQAGHSAAAGTVVAVQPAGQVAAGSTVVVTALTRRDHGHGHHHGDGQGGNGD